MEKKIDKNKFMERRLIMKIKMQFLNNQEYLIFKKIFKIYKYKKTQKFNFFTLLNIDLIIIILIRNLKFAVYFPRLALA